MPATDIIDIYGILGVSKGATEEEVHKAYRALSKTHHPDISKEPNAEAVFKEIKDAYDILTDPEKLKEYERFVEMERKRLDEKGFPHLYATFFNDVKGAHVPVRGETLEMTIHYKIEDTLQQKRLTVKYDRYINCDCCEGAGFKRKEALICGVCNGKGFTKTIVNSPFGIVKKTVNCTGCKGHGYERRIPCEKCKGACKLKVKKEIAFTCPPDIRDGHKLILHGRGDDGKNGGLAGALILTLKQHPDDECKYVDDTGVSMPLPVPFRTAAKGGTVKCIIPSGKEITVPIAKHCTKSGSLIIEPGEGMMGANGQRGPLYLTVQVEELDGLSDEQWEKLIEIIR